MLDVALKFLTDRVNLHLAQRLGAAPATPAIPSLGAAVLGQIADDKGAWAVAEGNVGVALVNVEEQRVLRDPLPESAYVDGRSIVRPPRLKLDLHVLFAARLKKYEDAWLVLSHVLAFFQSHPVFASSEEPGLDPRLERLAVELQSPGFEQLNQIWAFIGAKQLPSLLYRVRMVTLRDEEALAVGPLVTSIDVQAGGR